MKWTASLDPKPGFAYRLHMTIPIAQRYLDKLFQRIHIIMLLIDNKPSILILERLERLERLFQQRFYTIIKISIKVSQNNRSNRSNRSKIFFTIRLYRKIFNFYYCFHYLSIYIQWKHICTFCHQNVYYHDTLSSSPSLIINIDM